MLKRGQNPRLHLERHRERGRKRFVFEVTYEDLAAMYEMTEAAVRKAVSRGQLDPESAQSIAEFYHYRQADSLRDLVQEARTLTGLDED